ncbi:MAG: hypothetical protein K6A63_04795, partial [Acholeplasmatales bacterium]|nr:hypothetical protein [Acholeplasmatales bacterium]
MILFKKLLRTAWHYKAQFISMILMIAIGMGVFIGFNMEWKSIEASTNRFFNLTGYADFRIVDSNQVGFTEEQLNKVKSIDGVSNATRYLDMKVSDPNQTYDDSNNPTLSLSVIEDYGCPTKLMMMSDTEYDASEAGFYISDKYADVYDYEVGSSLTVKYGNATITKPILGLVKSGEYMICVNESNQQMMPDYSVYAYVFATPVLFQEFNNS